ncbi:endoribonuclease Dicer homolog 2 isoform X1 [Cucurbita maxima]|uniref:Endoribonuclease Dicer homolog 2 isoform X1 n=3 Tax=Cucurbita maxima TaxID=3661 RepID=A0A6J1JJH9_CUCMA|nr:endoribonuclease Dicer homolog 2 isoform X1 [Cucurbita maxima]XP_022987459.1 endoribonuclease Dicer homolog 2 isoform X1 [Cucurbita maxima]XP_022987460.1 endoribonuclease Dicer homolog 2 isoform X1 [Cucurbita maxima]
MASYMELESEQLVADPIPFARSYQLEGLEKALKQNTIVFLETGSGKTLIAIMLLRSFAHQLRKPSPFFAVFLVPQVVLVTQQAEALKMHTNLSVGLYYGDMGVDFWDGEVWKQEIDKHEVLVMTPAILLNCLRHSFIQLSMIKVLIIDECHHARGKHPYACIMSEFYHRQLPLDKSNLPRVFGMTASPIKSKGGNSELMCWQHIQDLESLLNSKVYTCSGESELAKFVPISTPKFKFYMHKDIPYALYEQLAEGLKVLKLKHERSLENPDLNPSKVEPTRKRISKAFLALMYCLDELGLWLAWKAAESLSWMEDDFSPWETLDIFGEAIVKSFFSDALTLLASPFKSGCSYQFIGDNVEADMAAGLMTAKVVCLIESLLEYRSVEDIRCLVFVERIVTAVALQTLLSVLLPKHTCWKAKYIAGRNSGLQTQTKKKQNEIVEEFRCGKVNIIVATSILEEGLDIQSCNLVIRFDPSSTVSSFIQSRGRARMQNSDYILMVKSGDSATLSRLQRYLDSGEIMRNESLRHASLPCLPFRSDYNEESYRVESTGAVVTLSSSVGLIYFYCSRLPSDCYFKPTPRWNPETRTLQLPKSSPCQIFSSKDDAKYPKQSACLEACKQLHKYGALTDNLVPDMVAEEAVAQGVGNKPLDEEQPIYVPPELVHCSPNNSSGVYHCYLIELKQNFNYDISVHNIVLAMRTELEFEVQSMCHDMDVDRGSLDVNFKYIGIIKLSPEQVLLCRRFQATIFRVLLKHKWDIELSKNDEICLGDSPKVDYLLLPSTGVGLISWETVLSALDSSIKYCVHRGISSFKGFAYDVQTQNGLDCICRLENSLVYTPHNSHVYCITGALSALDGNSLLKLRKNETMLTYKEYYKMHHGIDLQHEKQPLLCGKKIFTVHNHLQKCRKREEGVSSNSLVELPPELCSIIMSPISINTLYSYSFLPSIMHRLESMLIASNLKRLNSDHCMQNDIPTVKVLEAITTKSCQEKFHLESLETLGDSFLKYATGQHLFKAFQKDHEGLLSLKKDRIVCNAALCKLGCEHKISGFIRDEAFDPQKWAIPGDTHEVHQLTEEVLSNGRKVYVRRKRKVKGKRIADVVEALIGAYLSTGGERAAIQFLNRIGIEVYFDIVPYERPFSVDAHKLINVRHLEFLLNYTFNDPSLLLEAMTHGSYMFQEIPRCYQRLEFLGDSVLDYVVTVHLFNKYPGMSPGLLTDMRSASVNNDCYARTAVKAQLYKSILHLSHDLHKHISSTLKNFEMLSSEATYGWESETSLPKVFGDVIESLAGAIYVDSGYNKDKVFESIRPLLEPLISPETVKMHPRRELNEVCQKKNYNLKKTVTSRVNGKTHVTVEVEANGRIFKHTAISLDKETGKKVASKEVLKSLKDFYGPLL